MPAFQSRDGTALYAKIWGQGRPVVLIHGLPLNGDSWDPVSNALAYNAFRAIACDRRDFGLPERRTRWASGTRQRWTCRPRRALHSAAAE